MQLNILAVETTPLHVQFWACAKELNKHTNAQVRRPIETQVYNRLRIVELRAKGLDEDDLLPEEKRQARSDLERKLRDQQIVEFVLANTGSDGKVLIRATGRVLNSNRQIASHLSNLNSFVMPWHVAEAKRQRLADQKMARKAA